MKQIFYSSLELLLELMKNQEIFLMKTTQGQFLESAAVVAIFLPLPDSVAQRRLTGLCLNICGPLLVHDINSQTTT